MGNLRSDRSFLYIGQIPLGWHKTYLKMADALLALEGVIPFVGRHRSLVVPRWKSVLSLELLDRPYLV